MRLTVCLCLLFVWFNHVSVESAKPERDSGALISEKNVANAAKFQGNNRDAAAIIESVDPVGNSRRDLPHSVSDSNELKYIFDEFRTAWGVTKVERFLHMAKSCVWNAVLTSAVPVPMHDPHGSGIIYDYFLQAGDLPEMWLRDSTASVHHLLAFDEMWPSEASRGEHAKRGYIKVGPILEGLARRLAHYVLKDPMCSAWEPYDNGRECRGGETYNDMRFELDSFAYYLRFLRYLVLRGRKNLLTRDVTVSKSVGLIVNTIADKLQSGKYGMVMTESRPSDDRVPPNTFNIPQNVFIGVELYLLKGWFRAGDDASSSAPNANTEVGHDVSGELGSEMARIVEKAQTASEKIFNGIQEFGRMAVRQKTFLGPLTTIYCYEFTPDTGDRSGKCNLMDDANVPSLLSIPYFLADVQEVYSSSHTGITSLLQDQATYNRTRQWVLSASNPYFFQSKIVRDSNLVVEGIGSPHTADLGPRRIWPMSVIMRGLTTRSREEVEQILSLLVSLDTSDGGLIHETFDADDFTQFSRQWFDWANSLFAEFAYAHVLKGRREARDILMPPKDPFDGWVTCGWRSGTCDITATIRAGLMQANDTNWISDKLCLRFGSTYSGFLARRFDISQFPVNCAKEAFSFQDVPKPLRWEPYHCAIAAVPAQADKCPREMEKISVIQAVR